MTRLEELERKVQALSAHDLTRFREWFAEFDAAAWDREFEADATAGKLDRVADVALAEYKAGRSRPL